MRTTFFVVALLLATQAVAQAPDPSTGQINGRKAVVVMPVSNVERTPQGPRFAKFLSPEDCEAHLTPVTNLEEELTFPCGKWFLPPAEGRYRFWLEMPDLISEGFGLLNWEDEPFAGRGATSAMSVEPAGTIAISPSVRLEQGQSFRFVPLRAVKNGVLLPSFDRRVSADLARKGAALAVGPALSGIFDSKTDEVIALARPAEITAGKTTYVSPAPPAKGSDVFVALGRPLPGTLGTHEVDVGLKIEGKVRKPDAYVASQTWVFAAWYGVEAREATLTAASPVLQLAPTLVKLKPGKVSTVRAKLSQRPAVGVSIGGPEEMLRERKMALELRTYPARDLVQKIDARVNADFHFDALASGKYEVLLLVDDWEFREKVELTDADEQVVFTLSPVVVSGVVYLGRDAAPGAEVAFDIGRAMIPAKADAQGRYETIFWKPGEYMAQIKIPERPGEPFLDGWFDIRETQTLDFHVPNTQFAVNVRDAATGKPIAGAKVLAGSLAERPNGEWRSAQTAITNAEGRAFLPPMRPGEMTIRAKANGYFDSDVKRDVVMRDDARGEFEIPLRALGETVAVKIRNPDGTPAASAGVWAVRTTGGYEPPLWQGVADADGAVAVPRTVRSAFFLIRPRDAAAAVRRLDRDDEVTWSLSPAAPLTLQVGRRALIAVWIDDVRVAGHPLRLLTDAYGATDNDGLWSTASLPVQPLRVLAWRTASAAAVESGAYDLAATRLAYPWPRVVELNPVD